MKRFIAILTVLAFVFSVVPFKAVALAGSFSLGTELPVHPQDSDKIRIFQTEDWTYSIYIGEENVSLCAIDNQDVMYKKTFDIAETPVDIASDSSIENLFGDFFANLESAQKVEPVSSSPIMPLGLDYNYMLDQLENAEGSGYVNSIVHMTQYNGKNFEIREGKDIMEPIRSDHLGREFAAFVAVGDIITTFKKDGISLPVDIVLDAIGLVGNIDTIIGRNVKMDIYHAFAVTHRATYTSGVSYEINYTSKSNEYMFIVDVYSSSDVYPQMMLNVTTYQHGEGYFDNFSAQVQDAYENYYG